MDMLLINKEKIRAILIDVDRIDHFAQTGQDLYVEEYKNLLVSHVKDLLEEDSVKYTDWRK